MIFSDCLNCMNFSDEDSDTMTAKLFPKESPAKSSGARTSPTEWTNATTASVLSRCSKTCRIGTQRIRAEGKMFVKCWILRQPDVTIKIKNNPIKKSPWRTL